MTARRRTAWAVVGFVCVVTLFQLIRWFLQDADNMRPDGVFNVLAFGLLTVAAAGAAMFTWSAWGLLRSSAHRRPRPRISWLAFAACLAFGFAVSMPFEGGWDDGCNGHGASFPAISIPYLAYFGPDEPVLVYSDGSTLMYCPGNPRGGGFRLW